MSNGTSRKATARSRATSIEEIKSGRWRKKFDQYRDTYLSATDPEMKASLKSCMVLMRYKWGLAHFPEEHNYAKEWLQAIEERERRGEPSAAMQRLKELVKKKEGR